MLFLAKTFLLGATIVVMVFLFLGGDTRSTRSTFQEAKKSKVIFLTWWNFPRLLITSWQESKSFFEINGSCCPS